MFPTEENFHFLEFALYGTHEHLNIRTYPGDIHRYLYNALC